MPQALHRSRSLRRDAATRRRGHDRDNLKRGFGGPPDPDVLYDVELLRTAADGLEVQRAEQVDRVVGENTAIDTLLLARRPEWR